MQWALQASSKNGPKNLLRFWLEKGKLQYNLDVI